MMLIVHFNILYYNMDYLLMFNTPPPIFLSTAENPDRVLICLPKVVILSWQAISAYTSWGVSNSKIVLVCCADITKVLNVPLSRKFQPSKNATNDRAKKSQEIIVLFIIKMIKQRLRLFKLHFESSHRDLLMKCSMWGNFLENTHLFLDRC